MTDEEHIKSIVEIKGDVFFRIRFNTKHGESDLFWRVLVDNKEYTVRQIRCAVPTYSESSFDDNAGMTKYHIAGKCAQLLIDENLNAIFS